MARLEGKIAFVTGAAGGIGSAVVRRFLEEGALVAGADLDARAVTQSVATPDRERLLALACDVTDPGQVERAVARAVSEFGGLTTLCNTAGGSSRRDGRVTEAPLDEFWRVINVDLFGTVLACRFALPEIIRAGGGSVINLTSMTALMAIPQRDFYSAAKGGVASMTRAMALSYASDNVRVNAIAPGTTLSPRVAARAQTERAKKLAERHLLGVLDPVDIANTALFLASDESPHITGQVHRVDSGATIN
ncbi:SDR family NAD(P)-dependent oxidoreductase [Nocardia sp. NPDC058518]|uniref:SDR family NAD(P)-dependent oxidoreductase n=1 Tax=Nocardia sp. NPDC058518 TaxID=3346534 RepID=UPI00365AC6BD